MADPNLYFSASYAGIPLLISDIKTEHGRDVATQSPSRGDKHVRQDRGRRALDATVDILFIDQPGRVLSYMQRYRDFRDIVNLGESSVFTHPLDGTYRARISNLSVHAEGGTGSIACACDILAEDEPQVVFPVGAGTTPTAGLEAVTAAAATADAELAAIGLSTPTSAASVAALSDWTSDDSLDSNKVFAGVATLTQQISDVVDANDLASDLTRWQAYQALIALSFQVSRAGEALTSDSGHLFEITVAKPLPLLRICADVYGAARAPDRAEKIGKINRVRTPGRVPAGTVLKMLPRSAA